MYIVFVYIYSNFPFHMMNLLIIFFYLLLLQRIFHISYSNELIYIYIYLYIVYVYIYSIYIYTVYIIRQIKKRDTKRKYMNIVNEIYKDEKSIV